MADQEREKLLDQVKEQGDLVRKLKAAKADSTQGAIKSSDINNTLSKINNELADLSFVCGWYPTSKDTQLYEKCTIFLNGEIAHWPHLKRWYSNIKSYSQSQRESFPISNKPLTSLAMTVEQLNIIPINSDDLDSKVRQLVTCKWSATD